MRVIVFAALAALAACGEASTPASETPAPTPQDATAWDSNLLALMPQIDACIKRAPETRHVSYAGAYDGATLVRLQGAERQIDCRATSPFAGDITVVEIAPRDESLVIDGENAAIFVREPGENPGGECYEAPEVRDANGALLGWMLDPDGC